MLCAGTCALAWASVHVGVARAPDMYVGLASARGASAARPAAFEPLRVHSHRLSLQLDCQPLDETRILRLQALFARSCDLEAVLEVRRSRLSLGELPSHQLCGLRCRGVTRPRRGSLARTPRGLGLTLFEKIS